MGSEDRQARAAAGCTQLELHAVDSPEHIALAGERDLIPFAAVGELLKPPVVLLQEGADAQVPLRELDQPHRAVTPPAGAARLDLDRGEGRLTVIAPVNRSGAAVDEPRVEEREEQPLRPPVHHHVGADEGSLPVEGEAEPVELSGHVLGAARDPLAWRLAAGDRAELGRKPEGIEAEGEQHRVAAGPAEAGIGIADRVAAYVPHVDIAGGERCRRLYVEVRLTLQRGGLERVALAPGSLTAGLDLMGLIAGANPIAHINRAYPRAQG
jgi:hypothetical protein